MFVLLLAELSARLFLVISFDASLLDPRTAIHGPYSYLEDLVEEKIEQHDERLDVLLLGGSVLHRRWGSVPEAIEEQLVLRTRREVRVHSLAAPSHSSRDSRLQYQRLAAQSFDLVVFYHGINEARANNVPPELFHPDYDHYAWYRTVNRIDRDAWLGITAIPFVVGHALDRVALRWGDVQLVPVKEPRRAWLEHGAQVKTAPSFRANLEAIAAIAAERQEPLLLLTFAFYRAPDYEEQAFLRRQLDYTRHRSPIEIWGRPDHVVAAIEAHNQVVRDVAAGHRETWFVDVAARMPGVREDFDDICHLTTSGSQHFAELIGPTMHAAIERRPRSEP